MIRVDLITGFLGSGKTTFIKKYAQYLLKSGKRLGILENDYGAVNVDMMLLQELEGDNCRLEAVAGACDADCHRRRFKTKLIALGMSGYDRVLIEPSGIFDVDEFFDSLYEPPLDNWYEIGNVIAVVDASLESELSDNSEYLLASQIANAGKIILSKSQFASEEEIENTIFHLNCVMQKLGCERRFDKEIVRKPWNELTDADFDDILNCGYVAENYVKSLTNHDGAYQSLYFMNTKLGADEIKRRVSRIFDDKACGNVFRVKGFINDDGWFELNATRQNLTLAPIDKGQEIIIVIGEQLDKDRIEQIFND